MARLSFARSNDVSVRAGGAEWDVQCVRGVLGVTGAPLLWCCGPRRGLIAPRGRSGLTLWPHLSSALRGASLPGPAGALPLGRGRECNPPRYTRSIALSSDGEPPLARRRSARARTRPRSPQCHERGRDPAPTGRAGRHNDSLPGRPQRPEPRRADVELVEQEVAGDLA